MEGSQEHISRALGLSSAYASLPPSKVFGLEPGADGLDVFCLALQWQPMSSGHTHHGKVCTGHAHRVALTISGHAADLIKANVEEGIPRAMPEAAGIEAAAVRSLRIHFTRAQTPPYKASA